MPTATQQPTVPRQRRFTVDEYHRMAEAGVFSPDDRLELLDGHIYVLSPIGSEHAACVDRMTRFFILQAGDQATVRVQNPIRIDQQSEPEPDLALVRPSEEYQSRHPHPEDVLLLIEVADPSLAFDRDVKRPLYAQAGIPELWIVNLEADRIDAHRSPRDREYTETKHYERGQSLSVQELPSLDSFPVETLLGNPQ